MFITLKFPDGSQESINLDHVAFSHYRPNITGWVYQNSEGQIVRDFSYSKQVENAIPFTIDGIGLDFVNDKHISYYGDAANKLRKIIALGSQDTDYTLDVVLPYLPEHAANYQGQE